MLDIFSYTLIAYIIFVVIYATVNLLSFSVGAKMCVDA